MKNLILAYALALNLGCGLAMAQFSYPNCSNLKNTDFKTTELFNMDGLNGALGFNQDIPEPS